ncbi:MAG: two-component system, NarL family, sensor kinase [Solirubrobacteraceae bacterium]|nr:two-component system, NarL family, sensor kinase [Solirubrobacteraceae bacterium]
MDGMRFEAIQGRTHDSAAAPRRVGGVLGAAPRAAESDVLPAARETPHAAEAPPEPARPREPWYARRVALAQFMLSSAAVLVVVATIGAVVLRHVATAEAVQDARSVTVAFGHGVLRHQITAGVLSGDPQAVAALDRAVRERVLGEPIVRLKVWTPEGRIVYSDAPALMGRTFSLPDDIRASLRDNVVRAEVSDLSAPENRLERGTKRLVEVYLPLTVAGGRRVLVEAYHPADSIDAGSRRIWRTFLPLLVALLVALAAAQMPLAWLHTRRGRAEARERARMARETESALRMERGRIATELHDGVVQDLAGVAFALQAAASGLPGDSAPDGDLRRVLHRSADICRGSMTRLRELLVDLRAADDRVQDIGAAVEELAAAMRRRGVTVLTDVQLERALPHATAEMVHRAARESLRDAGRRQGVGAVTIAIQADPGCVTIQVEDDAPRAGHGDGGTSDGALGALARSLAARGGSLCVDAPSPTRTRMTAAVPIDAA